MANHAATENAISRSTTLLRWALGLTLISFFFGSMSGALFICLFIGGLFLALGGIVWRLFSVTQFRLSELLLLVTFLGNVVGWSVRIFLTRSVNLENILVFAVVVLIALVWGLGGLSNGLLTASRLGVKDTLGRLWLAFVFVAYPLAIFALPASVIASILLLLQSEFGGFLISNAITVLSMIFWDCASTFRKEARLAMEARNLRAYARR